MELPKTLLAAIAVGVTLTVASCEKPDKNNVQICDETGCEQSEHNYIDCPACGLG